MSVFGRRDQRGRIRPLNGATEVTIDFSTLSLGPHVAFTRAAFSGAGATGATYFDSAGLAQVEATTNRPRFTHNPTTLEPLGLMVEESRTQMACQNTWATSGGSDPHFIPSGYTKWGSASGAMSQATSIFGAGDGARAWDFSITTPAGGEWFYKSITFTNDKYYMISVYVEAISGTCTNIDVVVPTNGTYTDVKWFRDGREVVGSSQATTGRLCHRFKATSTASSVVRIGLGTAGGSLTNASITLSRFQVEECSSTDTDASSFMPNTHASATATRASEFAVIDLSTGVNNALRFGYEGSIEVEYTNGLFGSGSRVPLAVYDTELSKNLWLGKHGNDSATNKDTGISTHSLVDTAGQIDSDFGQNGLNVASMAYQNFTVGFSLNDHYRVSGTTDMTLSKTDYIAIGSSTTDGTTGANRLNGAVKRISFSSSQSSINQLAVPSNVVIPRILLETHDTYINPDPFATHSNSALMGSYWAAATTGPINAERIYSVYQAATANADGTGDPVCTDYGDGGASNTGADIDSDALISHLEAKGLATGTGDVIMLNFENPYTLYFDSDSYPTEQASMVTRFGAAIAALKSHFGNNIKIGLWGVPTLQYYDVVGTTVAQRDANVAAAVARNLPLLSLFDILLPTAYPMWADADTMNGAVPPTTAGTIASGLGSPAAFDPYYLGASYYRSTGLEIAVNINAALSVPKPIYISYWDWFTDSSALCFKTHVSDTTTDEGQYIPDAMILKDLAKYLSYPGVVGIHLWAMVENWYTNQSLVWDNTPMRAGFICKDYQKALIDAFYPSEAGYHAETAAHYKLPSQFSATTKWEDPAFHDDFAIKYNDRRIALLTAIATINA